MASNNMSPLRNFLNSIKNSVYNISIDGINSVDKNASSLFYNFPNLYRAISLNDMNYITDMRLLFFNTGKLSQIPNYNFNTSNVINMYSMFMYCENLTNIPNFNTSNVKNMSYMFIGCYNLINIPNFDTSNVINMGSMFNSCRNLINIPNFNTSSVTDMSRMFIGCYNLTTVSNLDTSNVKDMSYMFYGCNNLSQASVNNIVTSCSTATKVTNKNWTNIGFNVAAGSKWNTWIRTAPNYMNAVNIGWQNIGDAIEPAVYKRRIMVGDNLLTNVYCDCPANYYTVLQNKTLNSEVFIRCSNSNNWDILYDKSYEYGDFVGMAIGSDSYFYARQPNGHLYQQNMINPSEYLGQEEPTVVTYINDENPSYRHIYIEDENIRPLEVGDIIGPNTKFYFTLPDNVFELYVNNQSNDLSVMPLAPPVGEPIIKSNDIDIFTIGNIAEPIIHFGTTLNGYQIFSSIGEIINESIYTVNLTDDLPESNGNLLPITEYNNFDFWSKYILVDTRTLYRNVKVGDNLRNRTFYFTFPDNMYTDPEMTETSSVIACSNPYFAFSSSNFDAGSQHIAYVQVTWNGNTVSWSTNNQSWSTTSGMQPYQGGDYGSSNWDILYTQCDSDLIVTTITENNAVYKNIYIKEEELPLTLEEQALRLARSYYFNTTSGSGYTFSVATTRGEDVFVIQVTKNAAVQMWLTVNTTLGVVLEGSSNPTNEDYALALAEKYYKENYGNDTVYYGVATQKSETEFVIQVTQNAAVLMFLNVNVSTGEVTER